MLPYLYSCLCFSPSRYFTPTGLYIFPSVKAPFTKALSKKYKALYWFNTTNGTSCYECPAAAVPDFAECFRRRAIWPWGEGVRVRPDQEIGQKENGRKLQGAAILDHIKRLLMK